MPKDKRKAKGIRENHPVGRAEWDFSTCPEEQLAACLEYELWRESDSKRAYIQAWQGKPMRFDDYWTRILADDGPLPFYPGIEVGFAFLSPEFPELPFLEIPANERRRRLKLINRFSVDDRISEEFLRKHPLAEHMLSFGHTIDDLRLEFDLKNDS